MSLPKLFLEVIGVSGSANAMLRGLGRDVSVATNSVGTDSKKLLTATNAIYAGIAGAAAYVGDKTVKMAADFQTGITRIQTDGGELQQNLGMISKGILDMAGQVGMSTKQLTDGMMTVEAAGYHGADALTVARAAAEGAKVGAADFGTTANALTSLMNAYGVKTSDANKVMSQLVATVAAGKMHMEDLASSLSTVLPVAASAGISFSQVGGALATMTSQGVSAQQATQDLRGLIQSLQAPSDVASKEMAQLGLSSTDLAQHLGERGLVGTLTILTEKITSQMGPAGTIVTNALNQSKAAAADAQTMLKQLPPTLQDLAHKFLANQVTAKEWTAALKGQPAMVANLGRQFATTAKHANGFNDLLKSGSPEAQTYAQALEKATGGQMGLSTALLLTGDHMDTFDQNTVSVADAAKQAGAHVKDWDAVQKTFNQRLAEAKGHAEALGIRIGTALLPAVQKVLSVTMSMVDWLGKHKTTTQALIGTVGSLVGVFMAYKTVTLGIAAAKKAAAIATNLWTAATKAAQIATKAWTAAQWLLNVAMDANPIGLIVIAVAALAAGIFLLWTHSAGFRKFFIGMWKDIWGFLKGVGAWFAGPFAGFFVHAWHGIASFFASAWHTVADPIEKAWHWIEQATKTVWNGITGFFKKWWPLLLVVIAPPIALVLAIWNHFHKQIMDVVHTVWNAVKDALKFVWDWIKKVAEADWKLFQDFVIKPVEAVWHRIVEVWDIITKALDKVWQDVKHAASVAWAAIKDNIIKPIEDAWHQVESVGSNIWHAISSAFDSAWHAVEHIGDKFLDIGKNLVMGIVHGIEHAGGALFKSLDDLANSALKSAKSFLGISSPSKLFSDEVGQWIPHGIAAGIQGAATVAHDAVSSLVNGLAMSPKLSMSPNLSVAGGLPFGLGGLSTSPMPGGLPSLAGGFGPLGTQEPIVVQSDVRVYLDGDELRNANVVQAQRNKLRNGRSLMT